MANSTKQVSKKEQQDYGFFLQIIGYLKKVKVRASER